MRRLIVLRVWVRRDRIGMGKVVVQGRRRIGAMRRVCLVDIIRGAQVGFVVAPVVVVVVEVICSHDDDDD